MFCTGSAGPEFVVVVYIGRKSPREFREGAMIILEAFELLIRRDGVFCLVVTSECIWCVYVYISVYLSRGSSNFDR